MHPLGFAGPEPLHLSGFGAEVQLRAVMGQAARCQLGPTPCCASRTLRLQNISPVLMLGTALSLV